MIVRKYQHGEEEIIWKIFHHTIHNINIKDYSIDQVEAWAPSNLDERVWLNKIIAIDPYVLVINSKIAAYADLQEHGYIDHFYCHHEYQRQGIGSFLYSYIEKIAKSKDIDTLSSDISITAKPFFESRGFTVHQKQFLNVRNQRLTNYKMTRKLICG